jgi:hypothetical protein
LLYGSSLDAAVEGQDDKSAPQNHGHRQETKDGADDDEDGSLW